MEEMETMTTLFHEGRIPHIKVRTMEHDKDSELRQEAHDRACRRFDSGDFEMSDIRDSLFNLSKSQREAIVKAMMERDHVQAGKLFENCLYQWMVEHED